MSQKQSDKPPLVSSQPSTIDWQQICRLMLKQSMLINPLMTHPDEPTPQEQHIGLSLGLIEVNRSSQKSLSEDHYYSPDFTPQEVTQKYTQQEFFTEILKIGNSKTKGRRIALIGPSGTGKTSLLQKIANWILENTSDIPIWISLAEIGETPIHQYLQEKWLQRAAKVTEITNTDWTQALDNLIQSGKVWLLLDGCEQIPLAQVAQLPMTLTNRETRPQMLNPLATITQQLQGWTDKSRLIITSNSYLWSVEKNLLSNFDVFSLFPLVYPTEVKAFIRQWFNQDAVNNQTLQPQKYITATPKLSEKLGEDLEQTIEEIGREKLAQLWQNPLRLALLCRLWQDNNGKLPLSFLELYSQLAEQFYHWQAENISLNIKQKSELNRGLGRLALLAKQSQVYPNCLLHRHLLQEWAEDSPLFKSALRLGWLKPIGVTIDQNREKIYVFCDLAFQDYFAATAVQDWHFFLNHTLNNNNNINDNPSENSYRIFSRKWKQVILLWLGRKDISKSKKEAFLQALIQFDDGCTINNFYGKLAYFLAVNTLSEFPESQHRPRIINQLLKWGFLESDISPLIQEAAKNSLIKTNPSWVISSLIQLLQTINQENIQLELLGYIEKIGRANPQTIQALSEVLATTSSETLRWKVATSLGKIDPGNSESLATILPLVETTNNEEVRHIGFNSLEKIAQGNFQAITSLMRILRLSESPTTQQRVFDCIKKIGFGNSTAIAALVQLIRTIPDENIRRQAAETLGKIDAGNPTAIAVLIALVKKSTPEEIRKQAVYSLGEITPGNQKAIAALGELLSPREDVFIRWLAISSLGKIGIGNPEAIKSLEELIQTEEQALLCKEALDSLVKLDPDNSIAINTLVQFIESTEEDSLRREAAENLGKLDPGNPEAIIALMQLLHQTQDEFTKRQAAFSLGKIDPGNLEALKTLIQLVQSSADEDIRSLAAESLGEIGSNNLAAIASLIRLTKTSKNPKNLRRAAKSLGQIGARNREAMVALLEMVKVCQDESSRLQAADSLINLVKRENLGEIVQSLRETCVTSQQEQDLAVQKILWHCTQNLSYPQFYQAWHHRPESLSTQPATIDEQKDHNSPLVWENFGQLLENKIAEYQILKESIRLVVINSNDLIEPENPLVDIYDLMLSQGCPKFEYGIPETMAKLRLYWNTLRRNQQKCQYVLIFYENLSSLDSQGFSLTFLEMLSKFPGNICLITEQPIPRLQKFSSQDSGLLEKIITWLLQIVKN